jgi:UDP:flavonoid glycosyltransferase YjiC (YdhE family)
MSTIAIVFLPVPSVVMSAIGLARRLTRRGHRVCLISTPDAGDAARAEAIEFVPVLPGLFPRGSLSEQIHFYASLSRFALLRELRRSTRVHRAIMDELVSSDRNEIARALEQIAPDLVLVYSDTPFPAVVGLIALRQRLRCALVTPHFYHHSGADSPPLSSDLVPRSGIVSRWLVRSAWTRFFLFRRVMSRLGIALGLDLDLPRYLRRLSQQADWAGWPLRWDGFLAPMLSLPEFLLTPRDLDFPVAPRPGTHWLGWSVDEERAEEAFPWERVDSARSLVYCSFGTQFPAYVPRPRRRAVLQAIIDAVAARPRLQLALATGGQLDPDALVVRGEGVIMDERLPQLGFLRRARLMITHGGFNSIQECARMDVPMILFPLGFDQPGSTARVIHHGLGLRGDLRNASAEHIGRLIDAILADESIRQRCAAMAERSRDPSEGEAGMRALEALAERP